MSSGDAGLIPSIMASDAADGGRQDDDVQFLWATPARRRMLQQGRVSATATATTSRTIDAEAVPTRKEKTTTNVSLKASEAGSHSAATMQHETGPRILTYPTTSSIAHTVSILSTWSARNAAQSLHHSPAPALNGPQQEILAPRQDRLSSLNISSSADNAAPLNMGWRSLPLRRQEALAEVASAKAALGRTTLHDESVSSTARPSVEHVDKANASTRVKHASALPTPPTADEQDVVFLARKQALYAVPEFKGKLDDSATSSTEEAKDGPHPSRSIPPSTRGDQAPPRKQRPWSCQMYAALIQQLQECFPFDDFARRHSRPKHEVFDVFSAVVQLPLLTHSAHGHARISSRACRDRSNLFRARTREVQKVHDDVGKRAKGATKIARQGRDDAKLTIQTGRVGRSAHAKGVLKRSVQGG